MNAAIPLHSRSPSRRRIAMSLGTILLIVVILLLIGAIPSWPHSRGWGYGPSGALGLVLVVLLVLFLLGKL
jgi:Na+/melibiose symporter-like transporter